LARPAWRRQGRVIENRQIFGDGPPGCGIKILAQTAPLAGVRADEAGIYGETIATDKTTPHT
jgi:hypothetical protein